MTQPAHFRNDSQYMEWFNRSRLFELARRGRRLTHILAVIPLVFVFSFLSEFGSLPILAVLLIRSGPGMDILSMADVPVTLAGLLMALFLISAFFLIYVFVGAWTWLYEKRPFWTLGYERRAVLLRYGRGFLIGLLIFSAAVGILLAFGVLVVEPNDPSRQGAAAIGGVLIVLAGWIVQGGAEEVLVRGWVLPVLGSRYRPWIGLAVSSLLFAAMHGLNEHLSVLALINLALFGVFAGLYALREGSLWGISALHSAWNWVQANFFGFNVSGTEAGGGTLLNLAARGPDWITGGGFGPEGGVAVTAVLVIGLAVLLFLRTNPKRAR
jgi:membrane protease YdiL (CAAX protease family)